MYTRKNTVYGILYQNEEGPDVGSAKDRVIIKDGLVFRKLSDENDLLPYEDWRLSHEERARDLASRLPVEDIAGLMMYSPHQIVPFTADNPMFKATYNGKNFEESGLPAYSMTDQQKKFLAEDHGRYILVNRIRDVETTVKWSNEIQRFAEDQTFGIPVNFSSDPRHGAGSDAEYKEHGSTSRWPDGLAMAALFSPETIRKFGQIASKEYRAIGITTALSPQIDVGTEPRWMRIGDTYGCSPDLVTDYGKAYCDGFQTTEGMEDGWGCDSVGVMVKHWPGGASCEGGRDAHYPFGKYAVYPGNRLDDHIKPFIEGSFKLDGPTKSASAVMPYYTVSWGIDNKEGKNVGNAYSNYIIHDLLRVKYGYDGIVCTDWGLTANPGDNIDALDSHCFGVEHLTESERHLLALENGVDQFGGNHDKRPILEAYEMGCQKYGEEVMRKRMEESAVRLLLNSFRCGLFENPYLDPEESKSIVGCDTFVKAGYEAQLKSIVMLKNNQVLPVTEQKKKVYVPQRHIEPYKSFIRTNIPSQDINPVSDEIINKYYERTADPAEADFAIVFIESPLSDGGYSHEDVKNGGTGYVPVSLQYRPYTATAAREISIAGGDFRENFTNRSYKDKQTTTANSSDLDLVINTRKQIGDKPLIVCIRMSKPCITAEFEPFCDAILVDFGIEKEAVLDIISGAAAPSGLLPVQLPRDMETVEKHCEDVPFDMIPYTDSCGNTYDFGYGLDWSGIIQDERTMMYPHLHDTEKAYNYDAFYFNPHHEF